VQSGCRRSCAGLLDDFRRDLAALLVPQQSLPDAVARTAPLGIEIGMHASDIKS